MSRAHPFVLAASLAGALAPQVCLGAGATLPFTTFEAEAGSRGGGATLVQMTTTPTGTTATPEFEASGRAYVLLDADEEYVQWANTVSGATKITVRFCVPDSATGGGATYTLALFINGTYRQNLQLNSKYAWLYGNAGENGQSDTPSAGTPHVFWDDARFSITGTAIASGQTVRLEKELDNGNNAPYYRIDLIDLEKSTGVGQPANSLNVTASPYNVVVNDDADDWAGIQNAINDAAAQGKAVWMPSGLYNLSAKLDVKGVLVQGAGHWNTRIVIAPGQRAFKLNNTGAKVRHIGIFNQSNTTRSTTTYAIEGTFGVTEQWNVEDMWIQHTGTGLWMSDCDNGSVRRTRVYNTYADGINLNRGSHANVVEHNYVRGTGDDGIALISEVENGGTTNPVATNNIARFNTVQSVWWGVNFSLRGGSGHVIEDNRLADSAYGAAFGINLEAAYDMYPITGASFNRNEIVRGGGPKGTQQRGAIFLYTGNKPITGVTFANTTITNPVFTGVWHVGNTGYTQTVAFTNTHIAMNNNGKPGVSASHAVVGTATYTNGSITGATTKFSDTASAFTLTWSGF